MTLTARVKMRARAKWNGDNGRNINTRRRGKRTELNNSRKIGLDIQKHWLLQNQKIHHLDSQTMLREQPSRCIVHYSQCMKKKCHLFFHLNASTFLVLSVSRGLCWVGNLKLWVGLFGNEAISLCMKKKCHLRLFHFGVSAILVLSGSCYMAQNF